MKGIFKYLTILGFSIIHSQSISQEIPICLENDIKNSTFITAGFHTTLIKTEKGFQIFGQRSAPNGIDNLYYPTDITPQNGFAYEGEILDATLGDSGGYPRTFVLTTQGLYTWGGINTTLHHFFLNNTNFQKISLPAEITPFSVKKMEATNSGLVILTYLGNVYTIGKHSTILGDESSDFINWHKVNIRNVKYISISDHVVFAYTDEGKYYTWGQNSYLGNGTKASLSSPKEMSAPFVGEPKMIIAGVRGSYFVLGSDGKIYVLGNNESGQLGINSKQEALRWTNVLNPKGNSPLENVVFVNTTNNDVNLMPTLSSGAITSDGTLYLWGSNDHNMISDAALNPQLLPIIPSGFTPGVNKAVYVENGGHITPYVDIKAQKYGYVGHRIAGSMGTGTQESIIPKYDITNTADVDFCFMADIDVAIDCDEAEFYLNIPNGFLYIEWDFGDGSPVETNTKTKNKHTYTPGSYTSTITIFYNNQTKVITQPITLNKINVNLGQDLDICEIPITLLDSKHNPEDGYKITWTLPSGEKVYNIQKIDINTYGSGIYKVFISKYGMCAGEDEIYINLRKSPVLTVASLIETCETSVDLKAGDLLDENFFIEWKNIEGVVIGTNNQITIDKTGRYIITATGTNGCSVSKTVEVIINKLNITVNSVIETCSYVTLKAGEFPNNYVIRWKNSKDVLIGNRNLITIRTPGIYTVTVTSDKGCTSYKTFEIISINPVITVNSSVQSCGSVQLSAGDFPPDEFFVLWRTSKGEKIGYLNEITISESGRYIVIVSSNKGCVASKAIDVYITPSISIDSIIKTCKAIQLQASNTPETISSIEWKNESGTTIGKSNSIIIDKPGKYSVTVTNNAKCSETKNFEVVFNIPSIIIAPVITTCENIELNANDFTTNFLSVEWKNETGTVIGNSNLITIDKPGKYTITATSNTGCTEMKNFEVLFNKKPEPKKSELISYKTSPNQIVKFDLHQAHKQIIESYSNYTISFHLTKKDAKNNINKLPTVYEGVFNSHQLFVRVESTEGCVGFNILNLIVEEILLNKISALYNCEGIFNLHKKDNEIRSSLNYNYASLEYFLSWQEVLKGNKIKNPDSFYYQSGNSIIVKATVPYLEDKYFIFDLKVIKKPIISKIIIKNDFSIEIITDLYPPDLLEYSLDLIHWQKNNRFYSLMNENYKVYIRFSEKCISEPYFIKLLDIPNSITPNGDGINDHWNIPNIENYLDNSLKIFDRYGKIIFEKRNLKNPVWDGKFLGASVPEGTYWYILNLNKTKQIKGWVNIKYPKQ